MSSELMAAALRRSRYRMEVTGCTTDRAGIRSILSKKEASVALIGALKDGPGAAFDVTRELRASYPALSIIMLLDSPVSSAARFQGSSSSMRLMG
jgi:chemotaxis response regulator CheB